MLAMGVAMSSAVSQPAPAHVPADTTETDDAAAIASQQELIALFQAMDALWAEPEAMTQEELAAEHAEDHEPEAETDIAGIALSGLMVDETRTPHGRDFYDVFYSQWEAPDAQINYTVTIREQPGRGRGTIIMVEVNNQTTFRSQLQPRYEEVERAAEQAVQNTQQIMDQYDLSQQIY